jgi:hypothetical protein
VHLAEDRLRTCEKVQMNRSLAPFRCQLVVGCPTKRPVRVSGVDSTFTVDQLAEKLFRQFKPRWHIFDFCLQFGQFVQILCHVRFRLVIFQEPGCSLILPRRDRHFHFIEYPACFRSVDVGREFIESVAGFFWPGPGAIFFRLVQFSAGLGEPADFQHKLADRQAFHRIGAGEPAIRQLGMLRK